MRDNKMFVFAEKVANTKTRC